MNHQDAQGQESLFPPLQQPNSSEVDVNRCKMKFFRRRENILYPHFTALQNKKRYCSSHVKTDSLQEYTKAPFNFLKPQKSVNHFQISNVNALVGALTKMRGSLKCLHKISMPSFYSFPPKEKRLLKGHSKHLHRIRLQEFHAQIENFEFRNDTISNFLRPLGTCWRGLQILNLNFIKDHFDFDNQSLQTFASQISKLDRIRSLSLIFADAVSITDERFISLAEQIGNCRTLLQFTLSLTNAVKITDQSLYFLAERIGRNLPTLQLLDLSFTGCKSLTDDGILFLVQIVGDDIPMLKHLSLSVEKSMKITNDVREAIAMEIGYNYKHLETLKLAIRCFENPTDEVVALIAREIVRNKPALKHLNLDLQWCPETKDEGIEALALEVGNNLQSLQVFKISIIASEITDAGFNIFAEQIGRLNQLAVLSLDFQLCKNITDQGIKTLMTQIGNNLTALQQLTLNFYKVANITDEGIFALTSQIPNLQLLRLISLNFSYCALSNQGAGSLADQLQKIKTLQYIYLTFNSCTQMTVGYLKSLKETFGKLKTLQLRGSNLKKIIFSD